MAERPRSRRPLLSDQELAEASLDAEGRGRLPLELVDPNPRNPRRALPEIEALAANIKRFGLMQPVIVRRHDDRFEVIGGHRRRAAFFRLQKLEPLDAQWRSIPAVVVSADDELAGDMLISAQVHSLNWKPREQAAALERLVLAGLTLKQIGERLNRTESWASKRLRVYADDVLSGYVQSGQLATGVAEELLPIRDIETRKTYAERAVAEGWSQDDARGHVRALRLDLEISQLGRLTRDMVDVLSRLDGSQISVAIFRDLHVLRGRIDVLASQARGEAPRLPTVEEAEKSAGVTEKAKARAAAERVRTRMKKRATSRQR